MILIKMDLIIFWFVYIQDLEHISEIISFF